jgi:hypothetical protein
MFSNGMAEVGAPNRGYFPASWYPATFPQGQASCPKNQNEVGKKSLPKPIRSQTLTGAAN